MRRSLATLLCIFASAAAARPGDAQEPATVYVQADASGFTNVGAGDSSGDVKKSLTGKKRLRVVGVSSDADLVIRVNSREERKQLGSVHTYENKSDDGKHTTKTTVPSDETVRIVHATLIAGDFSTELTGESTLSWRFAADKIADQTDRWVKENYARLMERRSTKPGAAPAPASPSAAAAETSEASIHPGMTPDQVVKELGAPQKKVNFGQKSLWSYKGMQVVFENGKVSDVKF